MTQVHITDEGPSRQRVAGRTFRRGETYEVDEETADLLTAQPHFETGPAPSEDDEEESGPVTTEDVTEDFPGEDEWLEAEYEERVEAVESGGADSYLDEVEEVERSQQVLDAVEDRREELEG